MPSSLEPSLARSRPSTVPERVIFPALVILFEFKSKVDLNVATAFAVPRYNLESEWSLHIKFVVLSVVSETTKSESLARSSKVPVE